MTTAWVAVGLAAIVAIIVRLDARAIGQYFAFYELLPGMGITEAVLHGEERPLRLAVMRRFGYSFLLGLVLAYVFGAPLLDASLAGGLVGVLLIWPLTAEGLPTWAAPTRTLVLLYAGVVLTFGAFSALGHLFVTLVAEGDLVNWVQQEGLSALFSLVVASFGLTAVALAPKVRR